MRHFILILIPIIFFISPKVSNAEWKHFVTGVGSNNKGFKYYVDISNIQTDKGYVYYWMIEDYPNIDKYGEKSNKGIYQLDCGIPRKQRRLNIYYYSDNMGDGNLTAKSGEDTDWIRAPKNSVYDIIHNGVCKLAQ